MATVLSLQYNGGTAFNTAVSWLFPCSILFFFCLPGESLWKRAFCAGVSDLMEMREGRREKKDANGSSGFLFFKRADYIICYNSFLFISSQTACFVFSFKERMAYALPRCQTIPRIVLIMFKKYRTIT